MKRLISYVPVKDENGTKKGLITSISEPVDLDSITFKMDESAEKNTLFVEADIPKPMKISGKKSSLLYNFDTNTIEVSYSDVSFDEMTLSEKLVYLQEQNQLLQTENNTLKQELTLINNVLTEVDNKLNGGIDNE